MAAAPLWMARPEEVVGVGLPPPLPLPLPPPATAPPVVAAAGDDATQSTRAAAGGCSLLLVVVCLFSPLRRLFLSVVGGVEPVEWFGRLAAPAVFGFFSLSFLHLDVCRAVRSMSLAVRAGKWGGGGEHGLVPRHRPSVSGRPRRAVGVGCRCYPTLAGWFGGGLGEVRGYVPPLPSPQSPPPSPPSSPPSRRHRITPPPPPSPRRHHFHDGRHHRWRRNAEMAPLGMDEAVWLTIATAAGSAVTETAVAPAVTAATAISGRCRPSGWSPIVPPRAEGAVVVDGPTGAIPPTRPMRRRRDVDGRDAGGRDASGTDASDRRRCRCRCLCHDARGCRRGRLLPPSRRRPAALQGWMDRRAPP